MNTRRLAVTRNAFHDLRETAGWLQATYGNRTASRWQVAMWNAFDKLLDHPDRYPLCEEISLPGIDLRERLVRRYRGIVYRILYSFDDRSLTIHRVRNASQDSMSEDDF